MSKNQLSGDDFIASVFKPTVVISSSTDANLLCVKNHLTFTDLLKPFSAVNKDVILRDNNNISHCIKNLQINFEDINNGPLQPQQVKKLQNDVVSKCFSTSASNIISMQHGSAEILVPGSTPWFEAWRQIFVQNMCFSDHEFLDHYLACMFVVSTFNNDIIDQFQRLSQQLTNVQHHGNYSSKFFNNNILKYYVLLHDQGQGDQLRAEELYKLLKSTFGTNNCYLLSINSVTTNTLANNETFTSNCNNENETQTDPWIQFLIPGGNLLYEMMNCIDEGIHNSHMSTKEEPISMLIQNDPLALFKSSLDDKDLSFTSKYSSKSGVKYSTSYPQLNSNGNKNYDLLNSEGLLASSNDSMELTKVKSDIHKPHGQCLTPSDHERIRQFVFEFVSFGLMPWVETTLKQLSDQIAYKLKMSRGFFNVTRKFFGGNTSHVKTNPLNPTSNLSSNLSGSASNINSTGSMRVVYTSEAIEMQMRRHADLAFLFQQYEVAYQTYNVLKKDFQDDAAWLHYAGAMEMCALSIFLQGNTSQRQYPYHYMESAINIYLSHCRNIDYATRAALLNCEALKSQGLYLQASNQFIKLTTEENDLRSALLLEQSAHFYLQSKVPMLRKYAFHMILAGHRFSKAGQKKHTIRCYTQALPIFKGKGWTLAEDHIHATISRQAYYQKQLEIALDALRHLLSKNSRQPPAFQATHLRDFLKISKEYMESIVGLDKELINGSLPEFLIPTLDCQSVKVMLGHPIKSYEETSVEAKDIQFSDSEYVDADWKELELSILENISKATNKSSKALHSTKQTDKLNMSISVIGEPITVQVYLENPLHIPIVLTDLHLLWQFIPDNSEYADLFFTQSMKYKLRNCSIITDEIEHDSIFESYEFVGTEILSDMSLLPKERKSLELSIIPKALGILKIIGLAFYFNSGSPNQSVNNYFTQSAEYSLDNDISELSLIRLKGKIVFNIPLRYMTKNNEKIIDNKLELLITPQMPKLKVVFSEFPKSMIIDEISRFNVTLTNIGKETLTNVMLAVKPHDFLTFGFDEFCHSITDQIYQHTTAVGPIYSDILSEEMKSICEGNCRNINLGNDDQLLPGNSLTLPIWIRFHNLSCEKKTIKFLFYYESVCKHPYLKYRLLRHKSEIDLRSNMRFQGQFIRPKGTDNHSFFINMKIENQHHPTENKMTEFEIYQITSVSKKWQFDQEFCNKNVNGFIKIEPKETHSVCFKLKPLEISNQKVLKDKQYFSNVAFDNHNLQYVHTSGSPCSDFFYLHYFQNKLIKENFMPIDIRKDLREVLSYWEDIYIIILWKAIVNHSNDHKVFHEGQSHIFPSKIDYSNISGDNSMIKHNHAKSLFDSNKRLMSSDFNLQPLLRYSKIVNINQKFQQTICHNFNLQRKLIIPVSVTLYNTSKENIVVRLEPLDHPEIYNDKISSESPITSLKTSPTLSNSDLLKITKSSDMFCNVLWVGLSSQQFQMKADSSTEINLKCIVTRPGVYEIHSLTVKAAIDHLSLYSDENTVMNVNEASNEPISSELPFIKQENAYSSILIVTQDPIII